MDTILRQGLSWMGLPRTGQSIVLLLIGAVWLGWTLLRGAKQHWLWFGLGVLYLATVCLDVFAHGWGVRMKLL